MSLLTIILLLGIWCCVIASFDTIIKYQYENHYDDWLSEGKPRGMFFVPKDAKKIHSGISFHRYASKLRKELPSWAKNDNLATKLITRYLFWEKVWLVSIVISIPVIILDNF